jgi:hypothetical protein
MDEWPDWLTDSYSLPLLLCSVEMLFLMAFFCLSRYSRTYRGWRSGRHWREAARQLLAGEMEIHFYRSDPVTGEMNVSSRLNLAEEPQPGEETPTPDTKEGA